MFDGRVNTLAADARREALLREAKVNQLLHEARRDHAAGAPQAHMRLLALLGDLMVDGGEWLKARSSEHSARPYVQQI